MTDVSGPGGRGLFGLDAKRADSRVHVLPVPFEATTSYGSGTAKGPSAILKASRQLDLFDDDFGRPWEAGLFMLPQSKAIRDLDERAGRAVAAVRRAGWKSETKKQQKDYETVNAAGERLNDLVRRAAEKSLDAGKLVGLVGGDHSTPYGLIDALADRQPGFGILHFDAHHDLRQAYEGFTWSHASIMYNVIARLPGVARLVQVGIRDYSEEEYELARDSKRRIVPHYDRELVQARYEGVPFRRIAQAIADQLPERVYVSLDVDGLHPAYCPNTGTPVPGGLDFNEVVYILSRVAKSGRRIVGFDLVEVAPGKDEWDANVGARLLYKLIGCALR